MAWIYFIDLGEFIKIGRAIHPETRLKTHLPKYKDSRLLAIIKETDELVEYDLHRYFKDHLAFGREYYHKSINIEEFIDAMHINDPSIDSHLLIHYALLDKGLKL